MELSANVMKMWFITETKNGDDYDIKKLCDMDKPQEIIDYNAETGKITVKTGKQIQIFKTFKEAAIITIGKKITRKKELWDEMIKNTYELNNEISKLMDSLEKLRGTEE